MKNLKTYISKGLLTVAFFTIISCSRPSGDTPGSEYMPDMAHSIAFEANHNTYYYNNDVNFK